MQHQLFSLIMGYYLYGTIRFYQRRMLGDCTLNLGAAILGGRLLLMRPVIPIPMDEKTTVLYLRDNLCNYGTIVIPDYLAPWEVYIGFTK